MAKASYSRSEFVRGEVVLDRGVASVIPPRAGVLLSLSVAEGQRVQIGQKLATVRAEENMISGAYAPDQVQAALNEQDAGMRDQADLLAGAAQAEQARLAAQISGDLPILKILESQIRDQRQLIATAEADYNNAVGIAGRGYISKRDMENRQALILTRRQQLGVLQQSLSTKRAEVAQAQNGIRQAALSLKAQIAGMRSSRAALSQQRTQADVARGYTLTSPLNGTVTALAVRPGQAMSTSQQLMVIVPDHAKPRAELYVPTTAVGFLSPGQEVRLSVDAFPYQTFGVVSARLTSISKATVTRQNPNGAMSVYLVIATIDHPFIEAFGRRRELQPGMTLSARIITDRRSLLEWIFEPLFAVSKR